MNRNKLKNLNVLGKMNVYQKCMITLVLILGITFAVLTRISNAKVDDITKIWSPSLYYVQNLDTLTSDYRIKQYNHIVATQQSAMNECETELEALAAQITEMSENLQELIITEEGQKDFDNASEKWSAYKADSEEIMTLSRAGKIEEAAELMMEKVYADYQDFDKSFEKLSGYSESELNKAKDVVAVVNVVVYAVLTLMVILVIFAARFIGRTISEMITEPVMQIRKAVYSMRRGELSQSEVLSYQSEDELGIVTRELREAMQILSDYIDEISAEIKEIADGNLTKSSAAITDFLGDFSEIKGAFVYILKGLNNTFSEIQNTSKSVDRNAQEISHASQSLSDGATEQAGVIEELTATVETVVDLAENTAKETQSASKQIQNAVDKADLEKEKMKELTEEMEHITEISKEIENIIADIEEIASQTNLLALNASIEAARAGEAGKGFAVVADQIGKLAADSAQSAVNTRNLINKTLVEIEKGNHITISTSESFETIIQDMQSFTNLAKKITENANAQAESLSQIGQGIEQLSGAIQNTAAAAEENTAISVNLSDKAEHLNELVNQFELFKRR